MIVSSTFNIKIKSHKIVLNAIRQHQEISGAQLSRITQYQPSTLVYLTDPGKKRTDRSEPDWQINVCRRQTPTLWRLVADKGYVLGLEIIPHKIRTTIVDFSSAIIYQHIDVLEKYQHRSSASCILAEFIENTIAALHLPRNTIIGVGITFSGIVDRKKRIICYSEDLGSKT